MANLLENLILDVKDLDRSLGFYHQLLHLPVREQRSVDGHRLAYLSTGRTEILLLQQPRDEQNPLLDRSGGLVLKFNVNNLPAIARELKTKSVTFLSELDLAEVGESTLLISDPDGYAVLLSEPAATIH